MKDKAVSAVERVYKAAGEAFSDNDTQMTAITFGMKEGANDAWSAAGQGVVDALADNLAQRKEIADAYRHPSRADDQRWHFSEVGPYKDFSGKKAEINDAINLAYHSIDIAKEAIKKFDEVRSVTQGSIPSSLIDEEEYLYEKIEILKNSVGYSVNQLNQIVKKYIQPHLDNPTEEGLAGASASAASERERLSRLEEQSNEVVLLIEDFLSKMKSSVQEAASPLVFELSSQKAFPRRSDCRSITCSRRSESRGSQWGSSGSRRGRVHSQKGFCRAHRQRHTGLYECHWSSSR